MSNLNSLKFKLLNSWIKNTLSVLIRFDFSLINSNEIIINSSSSLYYPHHAVRLMCFSGVFKNPTEISIFYSDRCDSYVRHRNLPSWRYCDVTVLVYHHRGIFCYKVYIGTYILLLTSRNRCGNGRVAKNRQRVRCWGRRAVC